MAPERPPLASRPPSLASALAGAVGSYLESAFALIVVNAAWLVAVFAFALVALGIPIALVLLPLLALPTSALMRLGVAAARGDVPSLRAARDEAGRLSGRKVALATAQLLLLGVALTSLTLALRMGGLPGIVSAAVATYVAVAVVLVATALWPIVCDPLRAAPVRDQLRLATAVVLRRPLQLVVLGVLVALAMAVCVRLVVPALFLPGLATLAVAAYVVPAADELLPPSG